MTPPLRFVFPSDDEAKIKQLVAYLDEMKLAFTMEKGNKLPLFEVISGTAMDAYWIGAKVMEIVNGIKRYQ